MQKAQYSVVFKEKIKKFREDELNHKDIERESVSGMPKK